jgi:hypothetical protein
MKHKIVKHYEIIDLEKTQIMKYKKAELKKEQVLQ